MRQKIFATVIVIAVVFAQVAGMQCGFVCGHNESVRETQSAHCHKTAIDSHEEHIPCEKECDGNQLPEEHVLMVVQLKARNIAATVDVPQFVAVQLHDLGAHEWMLTPSIVEVVISDDLFRLAESNKPPAAAVQVARSVVLLV